MFEVKKLVLFREVFLVGIKQALSGEDMIIRDSDLPTEEEWAKFFNPNRTIKLLGVNHKTRDVADFGCGYGTFTISATQMISGKIYALDIEPEMVRTVERKAKEFNLTNVVAIL